MSPSGLGVIALGRPRAQDRLGGSLEPSLGLELLVRAAFKLLHGRHLTALLHSHDPLLLGHTDDVIRAADL